MKIAFIHNYLTFYRVKLFNNLCKLFDIEYFFYKELGITSLEPKFKYNYMKGFKIPFVDPDYKWPLYLFFDLIAGRFDVFIGSGASQLETMITFLVAKILNKPFILWNVQWFYNDSFLSKLRFPFFRYIVLQSNALIVPGSASKKFHLQMGVKSDNIYISPNAIKIDLDEIDFGKLCSLKTELNIMNDDFVVLCFSRISEEKGLEYLIDSYNYLESNEKIKYIISTTMDYEKIYFDHLNEIVSNINTDKICIKRIKKSEKNLLFYLCDLFILPSIFKKYKGPDIWGMVLNEALSIGKPLIATTMVGGSYDMIKQGRNGYIVPPKKPKKIAKAIMKIYKNPNIKAMNEISRILYTNFFKIENEIHGFVEALNKVEELSK
ncbi:MAG: glycosyltransferase family 4 protein [Deltaproteobacteria bacterium]|nr:glycosyltransferase family 4 protein [Deltaproteobacteria bacterium]